MFSFKAKGSLALMLVITVMSAMIFAGCSSSDPAVPEDYNYDDLSEYIKLGEYKGISYDKADLEVTDDEVKEYIDSALQDTAVTAKNTTGKAKKDSVVNIDYVGSIDGVEFEGGTAQGQDLDIANSNYIDGFAEAIIGHEAGETFDINVTFPDDYGKEELNGKDAVFRITLNYIEEKKIPEYNDEWVSTNTKYDNTADYEKSVREELASGKESEAASSERMQVFNAVMDASEVVKYPEKEYDARYNKLVDSYKKYAESTGTEWAAYLSDQMGMTEEQFESVAKETAEEAVKRELVLHAIAAAESIDLSDDDYNDYLIKLLEDAGYTEKSYEEEKGVTIQEYAKENDLYTAYMYQRVMDKVMEYSVAE